MAKRIRCSMNHVVVWVTPSARCSSHELMPFLAPAIIHIAGSHLSNPSGESSGSGNHPHSREPLVQPEWGVFKDGAELYGELGLGVAGSALEHPPRLDEANVSGPAGWTANPFRPAPRHEITQAIIWICEVNNCFHEGYWFRGGHKSILRQIAR